MVSNIKCLELTLDMLLLLTTSSRKAVTRICMPEGPCGCHEKEGVPKGLRYGPRRGL